MGRPRIWATDQERRRAQNERRKAGRAARQPDHSATRFIAIDGEGTGRTGDHHYILLGIGDAQISDINGIPLDRIFGFLWDTFMENRDAAFVGFFLSYDFTQWIKLLPENRGQMLFHPEKRARYPLRDIDMVTGEVIMRDNPRGPFPVRWEEWEFDILGMKRFKLRKKGHTSWMHICDAGSFFQAPLLKVIDPGNWTVPIVTEAEYQQLETGKGKRDVAILDSDMVFYNKLENEVLARLMERIDTGLMQAGIKLGKDQWFGPGQAAQKWLGNIGCPDREMVRAAVPAYGPDGDILHKGRMTYYGGWFEIFAHGHIPGAVYEYDINSAYPFIASRLPCLLHGKWRHNSNAIDNEPRYRIVRAKVSGSDSRVGVMLHRRPSGTIVRPLSTQGYYWETELAAGIRAGVIDTVEIIDGWEYEPCDCPCPLASLSKLYDARLAVGKNTPEGKAYKLIYNSVYGKFAQSIGVPRFANSLYASLIPSGTRTMILDALATHPEGTKNVVMVATDGIYFRTRHSDLPTGNQMGLWEESVHTGLTLFKPGIYWDDNTRESIRTGKDPVFKARGISARAFASSLAEIDAHFDGWGNTYPPEQDPCSEREGWFPRIEFRSGFSMVTPKQALQRGKWGTCGRVTDNMTLVQDADPVEKRHSGYYQDDVYWSRPYKDGGPEFESTPYSENFGSPDPEEYGITDDGTVKDSWRIWNG
jgi:DNA polymerase family B